MNINVLFSACRWFVKPLLLTSIVVWLVAPAYSNDIPSHIPAKQIPETASVKIVSDSEAQELKARLRELEDATRQSYASELERGRKQIDWWLTSLGILAAIMAILGGLIPYLMGRKDKEIIEQDKAQIKQLLEAVKGMRADAENSVERIHQHEVEAAATKDALMNFQSGTTSAAENQKVQEAVEKVEQDKTADPILRLRAEAVAASKPESAEKAYKLWAALAVLETQGSFTNSNAGYWAQELGEHAQGDDRVRWLRQAGKHYELALIAQPDLHAAAYNWGIALYAEAEVMATQDIAAARALWQRAGEQYQRALQIKPDKHEAASNWGSALDAEAKVIATQDIAAARALWQQAGEQYQRALQIKPDAHEAAFNWGNALYAEAEVMATQDIAAARALWQRAGEQYQRALQIKPDKYQVANNWGLALLSEAGTVTENDPIAAQRLLMQAEQLLLQHAEAAPGLVAYNLACVYGRRGDVAQCLKWLRVSQQHGNLPDCSHVRGDKDLDTLRNDPAFVEWFEQVCPL